MPETNFDLGAAKKRLKQLQQTVTSMLSPAIHTETEPAQSTSESSKFAERSINDLLVVEIFAGSAQLTKACKSLGLGAVAVDKTLDWSENVYIFQCDLTQPSKFESLVSFLEAEKENLGWVHLVSACGTASKARERTQPGLEKKVSRCQNSYKMNNTPLVFQASRSG